jgi:hypothetical protein
LALGEFVGFSNLGCDMLERHDGSRRLGFRDRRRCLAPRDKGRRRLGSHGSGGGFFAGDLVVAAGFLTNQILRIIMRLFGLLCG